MSTTHRVQARDERVSRFRVLIVDPDTRIAAAVTRWLIPLRCRVDVARDGAAAERFSIEHAYAAVLLDFDLTDVNALALHARLVRACPALRDRVVFLSGTWTPRDTVGALRREGGGFLEKPLDRESLVATVGSLLRR